MHCNGERERELASLNIFDAHVCARASHDDSHDYAACMNAAGLREAWKAMPRLQH